MARDLGVGLNIAHERHVIHSQGFDYFFDIVYNGVKIILKSHLDLSSLEKFHKLLMWLKVYRKCLKRFELLKVN
jgi:hypothetical protein